MTITYLTHLNIIVRKTNQYIIGKPFLYKYLAMMEIFIYT